MRIYFQKYRYFAIGWAAVLYAGVTFAMEFETTTKWSDPYLEIQSEVPPKHHINVKAPVQLQEESKILSSSPTQLNLHEVIFKLKNPKSMNYQILLYFCDDANTFCKKQIVHIHWQHP